MRNKLLAGAMALALVGCSEKQSEDASVSTSNPAAQEAASDAAGPDVALNAAPGVAFDYSYTFRLADDRIAKVQDEHAAACETLGVQHCRIVDVRYQLNDEKLVEAQAWTDATLALIEIERPQWRLRRIAYDGGEWHCAISRERELPDWLDQSIEVSHPDLALAILSALIETKGVAASFGRTSVPSAPRTLKMYYVPLSCDNFV